MHISLAHQIKPGQVYFLAVPKWKPDPKLPAVQHWNNSSVLQTLDGTDVYFRPELARVDVPLQSRALVLDRPGVGGHVKAVLEMYSHEHMAEVEVLCLVTTPDGRSFQAVVNVVNLWKQDPNVDYPPTDEEQGVDPNWVYPPKPAKAETPKDPHLEMCYFLRMLDRIPLEDLRAKLRTHLNCRHYKIQGKIRALDRKTANDACRQSIEMLRGKYLLMKASPEERKKYRLDE